MGRNRMSAKGGKRTPAMSVLTTAS
jgi:hypothetical protein